ncbi:MAG: hypothetical protein ACI8Y8_004075 [Planctomycetota bacterium]|jgi:hypothetical protein
MSNTRIIPLVILLLSAVALVAVMRTSSRSEVHGAGLPGAAEPSALGATLAVARGSELLAPPEPAATRGIDLESLPARWASLGVDLDQKMRDPSVGGMSGTTEPTEPASLEELREFRAFVSNSLSEIRHEEAAARLKDLERRAATMGQTIPQLARRLELSEQQARKMESELLSRLDVEAEYWRQWEQGADGEILDELKARDRGAHIDELSKFLKPEQLKAYLPN